MKTCPNKSCVNHKKPSPNWFVKNGIYRPKNKRINKQPKDKITQRYRCKACGKTFSDNLDKLTAYQKKPEINTMLFKLLVSGVSLRRAAKILDVNLNTVIKRFHFLADLAKKRHGEFLATLKTGYVQVDELETYMKARPFALTVPMVVRVKGKQILGFAVARIKAKGHLAAVGQRLGWTQNTRSTKFKGMIKKLVPCFRSKITFRCDSYPSYENWIRSQIPPATHHVNVKKITAPKTKTPVGKKKPFDALFAINNTFAKMRHDMNRLGRKTWSTTKDDKGLERHIWLYVAWNNKYKME